MLTTPALLALSIACSGKSTPQDTSENVDTSTDDTASELSWSVGLENAPEGAFLSAWGVSPTDIWVVGGQSDSGVVLRGSQATWNSHPTPEGTPLLNWIHGTAEDDIWTGGLNGTLLHWNGMDWTDHSVDIEEAFWGIYARSSTDIVAVGGESRWGGDQGRIFHFDGSTWTEQALPSEVETVSNLFKVTHDGIQYWIVGVGGTVLKGDGTNFTAVPTGTATDLITIHHNADRTQIVGGRGTGVVIDIEADALGTPTQSVAGLNGVHVIDDQRSFVVGERGYGAFYESGSFTELTSITLDVLHAAFISDNDTIYAMGGNLFTSDPTFHGTILYHSQNP
ncbi:MAG: hypothetical protein VXZ96_17850 [Myxococcota bacterium]|nr:hypothetical protein [Myxococcota bacterium]